jgi:quinohemoprotein amine dehydrogenase
VKRVAVTWGGPLILCLTPLVLAQSVSGQTSDPIARDTATAEEGIPVTDPLVIEKCGACHARDAKGNMSRISWIRTTPEGWSQAIKRMVRQNGLSITPGEAKSVVKHLATWHGLAPDEAKPVMYLVEHRIQDETNIPNDAVRGACATCHSFAQPLSWRRTKSEWQLLQNFHVALYSQADVQYRRPVPAPEPAGGATTPPATPAPKPITQGEVALDYMAKAAPLHTAEWAAWQSRIRPARLGGKWLASAWVPNRGRFVGEMTIQPGATQDEFVTKTTLRSLKDGTVISRTGSGIMYAGYAWRGRSAGTSAAGTTPDALTSEAREALWFAPDQATAEGRWYWGQYQEFGFDVKLTRASAATKIVAVSPGAVKAGTKGARVTIVGDNLPAAITPADLDLGAGVKITRIVSHDAGSVVADMDVAADAVSGNRDVSIAGAILEKAFPVYRSVDYLKVTPETSLARLGSETHPKGYQQFEAIGYENGLDGKPNTADDLALGPVDVRWNVEEYMTVYNDDDKKYVGTLSETAFFTPASDGPNPERKFGRNNYGEVWVVATATSEKDKFGKPLTGRSYLVVTVPQYQQFDQPEVSK